MFQKSIISIITSTVFISITLLAPNNNINAFAQTKKSPKIIPHQKQEQTQITTTQDIDTKKLDQKLQTQPIALQEITPEPEQIKTTITATAVKTAEEEPIEKLSPEERKAQFNKEVSELLLEYKDQLAMLEALETNPEFLKLAAPIHAQKKELEEEINKIICQFIPEMTMFYQQIQTLLKKYQEEN